MDSKVLDALNAQINKELASGYVYLSMSAHFENANLPGFAHWMRLQAQEELAHAMRLFDYTLRRGGQVILRTVEGPPVDFGTPLEVFRAALAHEEDVTKSIHGLYRIAGERSDYATQQVLQWFIEEQVEEEENANAAVEAIRMAGDNSAMLLMLDREFGAREPEDEDE